MNYCHTSPPRKPGSVDGNSATDTMAQAKPVARSLPPPVGEVRPAWRFGVGEQEQAHCLISARIIHEELEAMACESIKRRRVKCIILPSAISASVPSANAAYRKESAAVEMDVDGVRAIVRGT